MSTVVVEQGLLSFRRRRVLLENLTAWLFLAPAGAIIFLFGIFPVTFSFFVSLHRWRRFPDEWRGLDSYIKAMGNFGYVVFFWLALALLLVGLYALWRFWRASRDVAGGMAWLLPGVLAAGALLAFINWFFLLLPVVLNVPVRLRGQEVTRELFMGEFLASFRFQEVLAAGELMWLALLLALLSLLLFRRILPDGRTGRLILLAAGMALALVAGALLLQLTLDEIALAIAEARAEGAELPVWTQIILISAGAGLMGAALWLWQGTPAEFSDGRFVVRFLLVILAVIGAVLLIIQLPQALAAADDDMLQGFSVTVMYSFFSVPLQLTLGLGLAVLLFQNIRGKSFFRMLYFLPYITPFVATSTVFALLFSHRSASPANQFLSTFGIEPQNWLLEPTGVLRLLFGDQVPLALAGPGLALVVIIFYNVWVYAGYSTVIFLAGLGNIPAELYEAARIDGATSWKQFRHVTLPMLSPTTFFLVLIATIGTFQAFTQIFLMRRPGAYKAVDTINIYIYEEIQSGNPNYAYGSAMAFVLFAVILVLTLIQNRIVGRKVFYG